MQHLLLISELNSGATSSVFCASIPLFFFYSKLNSVWYYVDIILVNILLNNFLLQYSQVLSLITLD